jgi:MFS family permease
LRDRIAHPNVTFAALSLLFFVVSAGSFSSLGVVLPAMVKELEWSWTEAGLGFTLLGLTCGLGSFIPALLIRRIGVRGTMIVGTIILVSGFGAMALTNSVWLYFIATSLVGVAFAVCATVPGTHVLTALFDKRSTALGGYFTIGALGGVAGPLLYIALHDLTDGWRAYWWAFVIMSLLAGVFAAITTPWRYDPTAEELAAERNLAPAEVLAGLKAWTVRKALATPQYYIIVGGYTTYLLINTTAHGFAVAHLMERGISQTVAAQVLSLEALIGAGVGVIGGIIGEKVSSKMLMLVSLGAVTIGMVGLAYATGWPLMLVFAFGVGIGFGLSFIASTMLLFNYFGKAPNLELYSIMTMISTTAALGPAFGGWARDTFGSFSGLFLLCAALTALMLLATLFMQPPNLKAAKEPTNPVPEAPIL